MENHAVSADIAARQRSAPQKQPFERLTTLRLACEASGEAFDYDVPSDAGTLKDLWDRRLMVSCPHCRQVHGFLFRSAYVEALLDEPRRLFAAL